MTGEGINLNHEDSALNFSHSSKAAFRNWLIVTLGIAVLGVIQYLVANAVAMAHFPDGYSFSGNFLSDLGRSTHDYSDFYNFSLIFLGIGLLPLFVSLMLVDPRDSFSMKLAAGFGCLTAMGIVGLGLTPIDKFFILHHIALGVWLFPMFYMWIVFFYGASRSTYVGIGFLSVSLLTVVVMLAVLLRSDSTGYQVMQKMIVACGLVWLVYIISFIFQSGRVILKSMRVPDMSRVEAEDEYFSEMYRQKAARERRT